MDISPEKPLRFDFLFFFLLFRLVVLSFFLDEQTSVLRVIMSSRKAKVSLSPAKKQNPPYQVAGKQVEAGCKTTKKKTDEI